MIEFSIVANPLFYVVAVPAVLSIGIAKAGVGGTGGLATPLMALVITVPQAAAILLPIICLADIFAVWAFRKHWHRKNLWIIIPGGAVGVVLGTLGFRFLDEAAIKLMIGVIAVWFAVHFFVGIGRKRGGTPTDRAPCLERRVLVGDDRVHQLRGAFRRPADERLHDPSAAR